MPVYRLFALLAFMATPAFAQAELVPLYLYQVVGVAKSDSLNIRRQPDAGAEIIGALPPDSFIDVLDTSPDGRWALVSADFTTGWVSAHFLRIAEGQNPANGAPPLPGMMVCQSTSPAWDATLSARDGFITYELADGSLWYKGAEGTGRRVAPVTNLTTGSGRSYDKFLFTAGRYTGVLTRARCDDEETASRYAWGLDLITGRGLLSGCCSATQP